MLEECSISKCRERIILVGSAVHALDSVEERSRSRTGFVRKNLGLEVDKSVMYSH